MRSRVKYALTAFLLAVTLYNIFSESAECGHQLSQVTCQKRFLVLPKTPTNEVLNLIKAASAEILTLAFYLNNYLT